MGYFFTYSLFLIFYKKAVPFLFQRKKGIKSSRNPAFLYPKEQLNFISEKYLKL